MVITSSGDRRRLSRLKVLPSIILATAVSHLELVSCFLCVFSKLQVSNGRKEVEIHMQVGPVREAYCLVWGT